MPPTGAFGGNTGIHDAHNLAWKLAHVLHGRADETLLDSYDAERRPILEATLLQALARLQRWFRDTEGRLPPAVEVVPDYDVVLGQRLRGGATLGQNGGDVPAFADHRSLSGEPGTRIPHLTIERSGRKCSTLDLLERDFLLLSGADDWHAAAIELASQGMPLQSARPGVDFTATDADLLRAFGIADRGAVLVRPDGFVAWRQRGTPGDRRAELERVSKALHLRFQTA